MQPTLPILTFDDLGNGDANFISAEISGDGSKAFVSYFAGSGSTRTVWLEAFSMMTAASLYRIPVALGITTMAIRH